jgi:hypothetical protein
MLTPMLMASIFGYTLYPFNVQFDLEINNYSISQPGEARNKMESSTCML